MVRSGCPNGRRDTEAPRRLFPSPICRQTRASANFPIDAVPLRLAPRLRSSATWRSAREAIVSRHSAAVALRQIDRHRGGPGVPRPTPATPPDKRLRIRRFEPLRSPSQSLQSEAVEPFGRKRRSELEGFGPPTPARAGDRPRGGDPHPELPEFPVDRGRA